MVEQPGKVIWEKSDNSENMLLVIPGIGCRRCFASKT